MYVFIYLDHFEYPGQRINTFAQTQYQSSPLHGHLGVFILAGRFFQQNFLLRESGICRYTSPVAM